MGSSASVQWASANDIASYLQRRDLLIAANIWRKSGFDGKHLEDCPDIDTFQSRLSELGIVDDEMVSSLWSLRERVLSGDEECFCCLHPYLNCWEGEYHCMDCQYTLCQPTDSDRISEERRLEDETKCDALDSGVSVGEASQHRGVSLAFLLDFTTRHNCWGYTSWEIIRLIIKPATRATRCRYVELPEMIPHFGPASTFISYAQAGKWGDLVSAVLDGAEDLTRHVWIDIFAVRQWPSAVPDLDFASTIRYCQSFMVVCSSLLEVQDMSYFAAHGRKARCVCTSSNVSSWGHICQ